MKKQFVSLAVAMGLAMSLLSDESPVTSMAKSFRLYTSGATVPTYANALPDWAITFREGETVSVTPPGGGAAIQLTGSNGTATFTPTSGGIWKLANSNGEVALVGVGWEVHNDTPASVESVADSFAADTVGEGPNRKLKMRETPPVAYSGDDWAGDISKAATLTFTPPEGSGLNPTTLSKSNPGTGAQSFTFNKVGDWTVTLTFSNGTTRTAIITIERSGFIIIVK